MLRAGSRDRQVNQSRKNGMVETELIVLNDPMIRTTALLDILLDKLRRSNALGHHFQDEVPEGNLNTLRALLTEIRFDLGFQVTTISYQGVL